MSRRVGLVLVAALVWATVVGTLHAVRPVENEELGRLNQPRAR